MLHNLIRNNTTKWFRRLDWSQGNQNSHRFPSQPQSINLSLHFFSYVDHQSLLPPKSDNSYTSIGCLSIKKNIRFYCSFNESVLTMKSSGIRNPRIVNDVNCQNMTIIPWNHNPLPKNCLYLIYFLTSFHKWNCSHLWKALW